MARRVVLALLLFSVSFVESSLLDLIREHITSPLDDTSPKNLHCIYSRYMLYYFELNAIVFKNKLGIHIDSKIGSFTGIAASLKAIHSYDEQLRSQGNIVLAMLDELRVVSPNSKPPDDLMQVNLYLNNLTGTPLVYIEERDIYLSEINLSNYINGYKYFYKKMKNVLTTFIRNRKCYYKRNYIVRDDKYKQTEVEKINQLLAQKWPLDRIDSYFVLSILEKNKIQLETIFKSTFDRETYNDFKPDHLLFLSLVQYDMEYLNIVSTDKGSANLPGNDKCILDKSLLVSNVITTYKFNETYASIHDLFIRVQAIFHQNNVISFQQHVIVAALSPVLICLDKYLKILQKTLHPCGMKTIDGDISMNVKRKDMLSSGAQNLFEHLNSLMNLNIFPRSVQEYLKIVSDNTVKVIKYSYKPYYPLMSDFIDLISEKITKSMKLYNIHYVTHMKEFNPKTLADVDDILNHFVTKINNIGLYVVSLERYKYAFRRGLNVYDHENMFQYKPFDILNIKELGYIVVSNNIGKPPEILLING